MNTLQNILKNPVQRKVLPIFLSFQQLPIAANLQLQRQLGVLENLQLSNDIFQAGLQTGNPLGVLIVLSVVFPLHVGHLTLHRNNLVAQFRILSKCMSFRLTYHVQNYTIAHAFYLQLIFN